MFVCLYIHRLLLIMWLCVCVVIIGRWSVTITHAKHRRSCKWFNLLRLILPVSEVEIEIFSLKSCYIYIYIPSEYISLGCFRRKGDINKNIFSSFYLFSFFIKLLCTLLIYTFVSLYFALNVNRFNIIYIYAN